MKRENKPRRLYHTDDARRAAIAEIARQIDVLGRTTCRELSYCDYRAIVRNLSDLRDIIAREMEA